MHVSIPALLDFFNYGDLSLEKQEIARPFHDLAHDMANELGEITEPGPGAQLNRGLQRLLESRDCMLRAASGTYA